MMISQKKALQKEIHPKAKNYARKLTLKFAVALLIQAKVIAYKSGSDIVINSHIDDAFKMVTQKSRSLTKEMLIVGGSAFLGAFVQGVITEFSSMTADFKLVLIYSLLGILGLIMTILGFRN